MTVGSISSLGVGSGLDLRDILDQLREVDEAPITAKEAKKTEIEERLAEFDVVNAKLLTMKSHALTLSLASNFLERNVSVSDEDVLSATVLTGTSETTNSVEVVRLATRSSWQSGGVESDSTSVAASDTTFVYHMGAGGDQISVTVPEGTTIAGLAALINDDEDNPGVTAAVIDDGSGTDPYRLVLTADASGEDNRIFIDTQLAGLALTEAQGASASLNAEVKVTGITYERQANTGINDIIQGVTLNFGEVGTATVNVTADTDFIETEVTGLVEALYDLIQEITANSAYDEDTGEWGTLAGSTFVSGLADELLLLMGSVVNTGGSITSIYDLGMAVNRDGTITLDEDVLTQAISSNTDDVIDLFLGDDDADVTGLGDILNDALRDMTRLSGLINSEKNAAEDDIDRLEADIENATERLDMRYETLTRRFIALDIYMSQMQSTSNYLSAMFDSFDANKK